MTNIPTDYTIYTLMQDSVYRNSVANQNGCYNQPAHTSFYLGEDEEGRARVLNFGLPTYHYVYASAGPEKYADVIFQSNGGTAVEPLVQVKLGEKIEQPAGVRLEGYTLEGWYLDDNCTEKWKFGEDTVNGSITLYANWVKDGAEPGPAPGPDPVPDPAPAPDPAPDSVPDPVPTPAPEDENGGKKDSNHNEGRKSPKTYDDTIMQQKADMAGGRAAAVSAQLSDNTDDSWLSGWLFTAGLAALAVLMILGAGFYKKRKDEEK